MKFKPSTLLLVGVALVLAAGVVITGQPRSQDPDAPLTEGTGDPLFAFAEADVDALTVTRDGETLSFERDDEDRWQMVEPTPGLAEPAAVAFLLSRLVTDAALQTVEISPADQADFGLDAPVGEVDITLADGSDHRLILGGTDFSGESRYALLDPDPWPLDPEGDPVTVQVVTADVANGINRPLEEWLLPVEGAEDEAVDDEAVDDEAVDDEATEDSDLDDQPESDLEDASEADPDEDESDAADDSLDDSSEDDSSDDDADEDDADEESEEDSR